MFFQRKTRPLMRGKSRGTLACGQRRTYRTIPNTPFVRVFLHGDSDAETRRIACVVRVALGLDFSARLAVATTYPVRKSRAPQARSRWREGVHAGTERRVRIPMSPAARCRSVRVWWRRCRRWSEARLACGGGRERVREECCRGRPCRRGRRVA